MLDTAQEQIIDRARHPLYGERLTNPTHQADGANQVCGDEIHIELEVQEGIVKVIRHQERSCTICAAAADLLAERIQGKSIKNITLITAEEIQEMVGIPLSPTRLKCALLPLETLLKAF